MRCVRCASCQGGHADLTVSANLRLNPPPDAPHGPLHALAVPFTLCAWRVVRVHAVACPRICGLHGVIATRFDIKGADFQHAHVLIDVPLNIEQVYAPSPIAAPALAMPCHSRFFAHALALCPTS